MRSHEITFDLRDTARILGPTHGWLAFLALVLHLGSVAGWLPSPRPALDIDRTILIHQAEASQQPRPADWVLIGDSSGLMNVAALELGRSLRASVLNLSTLSYLDLPTHARLLREYARANPGCPRNVVLLLHPESLRLAAVPAYFRTRILDYLAGRDGEAGPGWGGRLEWLSGVSRLRNRLLSRALPWPLPGEYGRFYGFTSRLGDYLSEHAGSAVDPHRFDPGRLTGSAEYRLAVRFEAECRHFSEALSDEVRLVIGLTPTPASFALPDHEERCRGMLSQLAEWLAADAVLDGLPTILPDERFATKAHLNEGARLAYTRLLAAELAGLEWLPNGDGPDGAG